MCILPYAWEVLLTFSNFFPFDYPERTTPNSGIISGIIVTEIVLRSMVEGTTKGKTKQSLRRMALGPLEVRAI